MTSKKNFFFHVSIFMRFMKKYDFFKKIVKKLRACHDGDVTHGHVTHRSMRIDEFYNVCWLTSNIKCDKSREKNQKP